MMWFILVAAQPAPPPTPPASAYTRDARGLFGANDYPTEALDRGESGTVIASVVIDDSGKVETCSVVYSSQSKSLDRATCRIIQDRARFKPATDSSGRPIYSVVLTPPITWFTSDNIPTTKVEIRPDAEIGISQAPPGMTLPLDVSVHYIVNAAGEISSCEADSPSENPKLVAIACDGANLPKPLVTKNKAGKPVDVVYKWKAHFMQGTP